MTQNKTHHSAKERLDSLKNRAELGGGTQAIERHHQRGKLTARERLALLFDDDSFVDINSDVCIIPPNSFALSRTAASTVSPAVWNR